MKHTHRLVAGVVVAVLGTASLAAQQIVDVQRGKVRVVTVATGLVHPWSIVFLPDGRMLVTEQAGRLRIVQNGTLEQNPVWTAPVPLSGPKGERINYRLHSVAVQPQFAQNRLVYVSYPNQREKGNTLAIARGRLDVTTLADVKDNFVADAWEASGNMAGRMIFGPDAMLYVTVGDRDRL